MWNHRCVWTRAALNAKLRFVALEYEGDTARDSSRVRRGRLTASLLQASPYVSVISCFAQGLWCGPGPTGWSGTSCTNKWTRSMETPLVPPGRAGVVTSYSSCTVKPGPLTEPKAFTLASAEGTMKTYVSPPTVEHHPSLRIESVA